MTPSRIHRLTLTHFRNYRAASLQARGDVVVLVGPNGAGKTNCLEAISFLSPGRGLRRATLEDVADNQGDGSWAVSAEVEGAHAREDVREPGGRGRPGEHLRVGRRQQDRAVGVRDVPGDRDPGRMEEVVDPRHGFQIPGTPYCKRRRSGPSYHRRVAADLRTERLLLRQWRDEDLEPFAALNADVETMRYFPAPPSRAQSDALAEHARRQIEEEGWGLWAVEVVGGASFIGFVGLVRSTLVPG